MKIVFDTNVLISGFITTTGPSAYVLTKAFKKHDVITSRYILEEFEVKLTQKLKFPKGTVRRAAAYLKKRTSIVTFSPEGKTIFSDTKDMPILHLLEFAKPHFFITGDKRLLTMKRLGPTAFLSPREAMEWI